MNYRIHLTTAETMTSNACLKSIVNLKKNTIQSPPSFRVQSSTRNIWTTNLFSEPKTADPHISKLRLHWTIVPAMFAKFSNNSLARLPAKSFRKIRVWKSRGFNVVYGFLRRKREKCGRGLTTFPNNGRQYLLDPDEGSTLLLLLYYYINNWLV